MSESNINSRLEAFCDGVFAIALTLLIIEIKIPSNVEIHSTADFWLVLEHMIPAILAFVLSFTIILITWVNHHNGLKLINKSSAPFIYANGFLLLTVVFMPFPTALVGEYVLTEYGSPAVILFNGVLALQALGWILMSRAALNKHLGKNEKSTFQIKVNGTHGYYGLILYSLLALLAFWFPLTAAIITTITWVFWLIYGININRE